MSPRFTCCLRAALVLAVSAVSGCGVLSALGWLPRNDLRELQVVTAPDANLDSATAIDVVFAFDAASAAALPRTGPQWFASREALGVNLGPGIAVVSLQLPPGSGLSAVTLPPNHRKAVAVFAFVNFLLPAGNPAATLAAMSCARISVLARSVAIENCT